VDLPELLELVQWVQATEPRQKPAEVTTTRLEAATAES
jgi:hypothetical protein